MNLPKFILYELYDLTAYGIVLWALFLAIAFCGTRYLRWFGFLLVPVVITLLVIGLDIHWIFQDMREHPENGRDADFIFWFGVLCRIVLLNIVLIPVSILGLRLWPRRRKTQHEPTVA